MFIAHPHTERENALHIASLISPAHPSAELLREEGRPFRATPRPRGFLFANKKLVNSSRFRGGAIASQKDLWQCRVQLEVEGQREERISPDPAILLPLFHHNHHLIHSNWYHFYTARNSPGLATVKVSPLLYWTLSDYGISPLLAELFSFCFLDIVLNSKIAFLRTAR